MKSNSILVHILWIGLCVYSVSSYPAEEEELGDDGRAVPMLPAEIVTIPKTYTMSRDESVTLECEVKNADPDSALVWNKNNATPIYVDEKCFAGPSCQLYASTFKGNFSTFTIRRVNEETAGNYFCIYRVASIMYQVFLKVTVDAISGPKSVEFGDTLSLYCRVSGYPFPEVTWHMQANDTALPVAMGQGQNLTISNVTSAHSGIYTCTALNNDSPVSRSIQISIVKGIAATTPIINAGESSGSVDLCCNHGNMKGETSLKWLKNGKDVPADGRHQINKSLKTKSCMTIFQVKEEDLGTYTCQLTKSVSASRAPISAQIELTGIPVTPELLEVTSDSNKTPLLKWKVKTFSPLTSYQVRVKKQEQTDKDWLEQANKMLSSNSKEEIITQALDSVPNGVYDVELIVVNKFGSARLVSNNKVAVDRSEHEVIAEKIKNSDGSGASRSIGISLCCIILGVVLSKL